MDATSAHRYNVCGARLNYQNSIIVGHYHRMKSPGKHEMGGTAHQRKGDKVGFKQVHSPFVTTLIITSALESVSILHLQRIRSKTRQLRENPKTKALNVDAFQSPASTIGFFGDGNFSRQLQGQAYLS